MTGAETRTFRTVDLVTAVSGIVLTIDAMDGVQSILSHVLGESVFTHQLPAAIDVARPGLTAQHPWLPDAINHLDVVRAAGSEQGPSAWCPQYAEWLTRNYGPTVTITPIPDAPWTKGNAINDLVGMLNHRDTP